MHLSRVRISRRRNDLVAVANMGGEVAALRVGGAEGVEYLFGHVAIAIGLVVAGEPELQQALVRNIFRPPDGAGSEADHGQIGRPLSRRGAPVPMPEAARISADLTGPARSTRPRPKSRNARTGATSLEKRRLSPSVMAAMPAVS